MSEHPLWRISPFSASTARSGASGATRYSRAGELAASSRRGGGAAGGRGVVRAAAREARLRPERASQLRAAPAPPARLERLLRAADERRFRPLEGRARDDRRRGVGRERVQLLHRGALGGAAKADEGSGARGRRGRRPPEPPGAPRG